MTTTSAAGATADPVLARIDTLAPGTLQTRAIDRLALAHDASHYLLTPRAVVRARDAEHVAAVLRLAHETATPVAFRSGGTSLSGQASTDAVLLDTRRAFRGIEVLDDGRRVRVQPGATVRQVNARLARHGRKLGPDPASEAACTIGGVVADNSSGMACGITDNTYRTLESAVLVLPDGTVVDTAPADADERLRASAPALWQGLADLRSRVMGDPASLERIAAQYSIKNTMGYGVNAFVDFERPVDILTRLVIGSEGTLAFVAEATFRTVPVRKFLATGMLYFSSLADATGALPALVAAGFATIELLDATSLRVAQRDAGAPRQLRELDVARHAALLVEYQEDTAQGLDERLAAWRALAEELPLAMPADLTTEASRRAALWHIRKDLYATVAGARPSGTTALLEDVAVPVDRLRETCEGLIGLFERHGYRDSVIFGHAKDGNIHFMITEHFDDPASLDRYAAFTEEMVDLVLGHEGTLKAEHGTGRIMAPYVRRQFGDELYDVMRQVKRLLDPRGVLNPGVLLDEDPDGPLRHLKLTPTIESEADRCVECGYCEPVCPSKDLTVTPRQRIALRRERVRALAAGDDALAAELDRDYDYAGLDTCAADGMCQTACPVLIDTGALVKRLRGERGHGAVGAGWNLAADHWGAVTRAGALALNAAAAMPTPVVAAATDAARAVLGADAVPRYQAGLPAGGTARRARDAARPVAVYLPSCIGSMFAPGQTPTGERSLGVREAFLRLCARAGVEVRIPQGIDALCCGTPWSSKGLPKGKAHMVERVRAAVLAASDGGRLPVVGEGVSCTEGFLAQLEETPATVIDAVAFVEREVMPRLTVTRRVPSIAVHPTCSSTHLGVTDPMVRIAEAVADEVVVPDAWGCCAFAGDRGMLHPELTASATTAEAAEVTARVFTEYVSANRTCELGMTRATGRPYRHVLEVLEEATRPVSG